VEYELELESGYLMTLYIVSMTVSVGLPISCVRRQASDPWLILTTVGESGDESLPGPLPDVHRIVGNVKLIFRWLQLFLTAAAISFREQLIW